MALKDELERKPRKRGFEGKLPDMSKIAEKFNSQDVRVRFNALDAWADCARDNPGNPEVLKYLPEIIRHFSEMNAQVLGAALDAWKAAAKANPGNEDVLKYTQNVAEKFMDPDELVRYAAISAWEVAAKANHGHPMIENTREAYEAEQRKKG